MHHRRLTQVVHFHKTVLRYNVWPETLPGQGTSGGVSAEPPIRL